MEFSDRTGQRRHQIEIELTRRRKPVEQRLLWKLVHLNDPVRRRAAPTERERAVGLASNREDSAVEAWCRATVQPDFCFAHRATTLARREVEVVEPNGPFELVCAIPGEKNDGRVGIDTLDRSAAVGRRCSEEVHDR